MATITLTVSTIDKNAKSITLKATTDGVVPTTGSLTWRYWTATTSTETVLTGAQVAELFGAGLMVTPESTGLGTADAVFSDGEHHVIYTDGTDTADLKVLVNKAAEKCITGAVGRLAEQPCDCLEAEKLLNKLIRWRFAADVKHGQKDYDGAHNLIVAINLQCQGTDCNC